MAGTEAGVPATRAEAQPDPATGRVADTIQAPSLVGNLLGDPTRQPIWVYLPPGYDLDPERRYPTLYLLHGVLDDPSVWLEPVYLHGQPDRGRGDRAMIVVMPNGRNALGGSYYRNSPVPGGARSTWATGSSPGSRPGWRLRDPFTRRRPAPHLGARRRAADTG